MLKFPMINISIIRTYWTGHYCLRSSLKVSEGFHDESKSKGTKIKICPNDNNASNYLCKFLDIEEITEEDKKSNFR